MTERDTELREVPKGWVWTSIGDLVSFEYGKSLIESKRDQNGIIPVYGSNGIVGKHSSALTSRPSIIVGRKGAAGAVHLAKVPCWPIDTTYYVYPPQGIDLIYLYYSLWFLKLKSLDKSTAIPGLNRDDAYKINFPLPPLPEQHRIVAKIEELFTRLDAGVEALKKIQLQLKRYRQSVLKSAFEGKLTAEWREVHQGELEPASALLERIKAERKKSGKYKELPPLDTADLPELPEGWAYVRIEEICDLINGRAFKPTEWTSHGIPIIRIQNLNNIDAEFNYCIFQVEEKYIVNDGQLLFAWSGTPGTSFGAHIWQRGKAVLNQHIFKVMIDEININKLFFMYLINCNIAEYIGKAHGTAGLAHITKGKFDESMIYIPSFTEQQKIVEEIERHFSVADKIERTIKQSLKQAERLRQSILKQAFEGQLVLQDPSDEPAEKLLERIRAEKAKNQTNTKIRRAVNAK